MKRRGFILILTLIFCSSLIIKVSGENGAIDEVEEEIDQIEEEEEKIIEVLYKLEQEIAETQGLEIEINGEIDGYKVEIEDLETRIEEESTRFESNKDVLAEVLKIYQKQGPASYVEILLSSSDLSDFVKRINIIRDLSKETDELLQILEFSQVILEESRIEVEQKLRAIEIEKEKLLLVMEEQNRLKEEQEAVLVGLQEERSEYEAMLQEMVKAWEAFKPVFAQVSGVFLELAENGDLPEDAMTVDISLLGVTATLTEKSFNEAIGSSDQLPEMIFSFEEERIIIELADYGLVLQGNFVVENERVLVFKIESGSFYEVALEESSLNELVEEGELALNLEPILGKNKIKSVNSDIDKLVLSIKISLY